MKMKFVFLLTCSFVLGLTSTSDTTGQVLQPLPGPDPTIGFVHQDSLILKAGVWSGADAAGAPTYKDVPQWYEYRKQYGSATKPAGTTIAADLTFGAFVVANLNDSDSDGITDAEDNTKFDPIIHGTPSNPVTTPPRAPAGNGVSAAFGKAGSRGFEPDLIKLTITVKDGDGQTTDGYTSIGSSSPSRIYFWADAMKSKPIGGFAAHGPVINGAKLNKASDFNGRRSSYKFYEEKNIEGTTTQEVWVEVVSPSSSLEDDVIWVDGPAKIHQEQDPISGPINVVDERPRDLLSVTAIWGQKRKQWLERKKLFKVESKLGNEITLENINGGDVTNPLSDDPNPAEVFAIYDDDHNNNDPLYQAVGYHPPYDTGRKVWGGFVTDAFRIGGKIKVQFSAQAVIPNWVSPGDSVYFGRAAEIDGAQFNNTLAHILFGMGKERWMQNGAWGQQSGIDLYPKGIMRTTLSIGGKPSFDITQQMRLMHRTNGNTVIRNEPWPAFDELPNDDGNQTDEDNVVFNHPGNCKLVGGTASQKPTIEEKPGFLDFDSCFLVDCPGAYKHTYNWPLEDRFAMPDIAMVNPNHSWQTYRGNFTNFVRIDLTGGNNLPTSNPSDWKKFSRCSYKQNWHTVISFQSDHNKPVKTAPLANPRPFDPPEGVPYYFKREFVGAGGEDVWENLIKPGHMTDEYLEDDPAATTRKVWAFKPNS